MRGGPRRGGRRDGENGISRGQGRVEMERGSENGEQTGRGEEGAVKRRSGEEMEREKARDVGEGRSGIGIGAWEWTGERREGGGRER